jgi:DNA-binding MarR family transcriptional regulator
VLCSKRGRWNVYKKVLIYLLVNDGGLGGADIGRLIGMHQSSISKAVKRIEDKMTKNKLLCEEIKKIRVIYSILNIVLI